MSPEGAQGRCVELIGVSDLGDHPDRQLRRQPVGFTNAQVAPLLKVELLERARLPRKFAYQVTSGVRSLKGATQGICLSVGRGTFDLCYELHLKHSIVSGRGCQAMQTSSQTRDARIRGASRPCAAPAFPPPGLKPCGFHAGLFL